MHCDRCGQRIHPIGVTQKVDIDGLMRFICTDCKRSLVQWWYAREVAV